MKKRKLCGLLSLLMVVIMITGMMAGCGNSTEEKPSEPKTESTTQATQASTEQNDKTEDEGVTYPISTDVELSFYITDGSGKTANYPDFNSVPFYAGLSKNVGINVDWQAPAEGAEPVAAFNLLLQEEELPSIIYGNINSAKRDELYADGLIYDLTEYLPKYAPDFWEFINLPENEANKRVITNNEGKILGFPFIRESDFCITYLGPVIRQDWLKELGLETPVTLDDWEKVLVAFKDKYGAYMTTRPGRFQAGISSGTGAFAALGFGMYVEDGEVKCANTQNEWKEMLTYLNRWYDNGLLDPDFATIDDATIRSKALKGECGIVVTAMSQLTNFIADAEAEGTGAEWIGFSHPRTAAGAPTSFIQTETQLARPDISAVVTTSCSEEELIAAIKFLNYGFTEEGILYWNFGEEGVSYEVGADGSLQFTELLTADERGLGTAMKDYTGMWGGGPGIQLEALVKAKNNPAAAAAVYAWTDNSAARDYKLPPYSRTEEEQTRYNDIVSVLGTYVSEMAFKFISGDEKLEDFEKFVETLYSYDLQELLEIEQAAYDRYMK